jgi:hypothetical protein
MTAQDELADSGVPPQLDLSISYNKHANSIRSIRPNRSTD